MIGCAADREVRHAIDVVTAAAVLTIGEHLASGSLGQREAPKGIPGTVIEEKMLRRSFASR